MLTGENFNSNAPQKSIKALPSHSLYHSPSKSAEDAVLLPEFRVPQKSPFTSLTTDTPKAGVQRTQSFARIQSPSKIPFYLSYHRYHQKKKCRGLRPLT